MAQYRLTTLLDMRERTKKEKEDLFADAKKKLYEQQQIAENLRKQHQQMKDNRTAKANELQDKMRKGELGVNDYLNGDRYLKRLDQEIEDFKEVIREQDKKVIFAQQEVDWANEEMLKATQDYKALEKHKEKWQEEVKQERIAKEELDQEEIASVLYAFKER